MKQAFLVKFTAHRNPSKNIIDIIWRQWNIPLNYVVYIYTVEYMNAIAHFVLYLNLTRRKKPYPNISTNFVLDKIVCV